MKRIFHPLIALIFVVSLLGVGTAARVIRGDEDVMERRDIEDDSARLGIDVDLVALDGIEINGENTIRTLSEQKSHKNEIKNKDEVEVKHWEESAYELARIGHRLTNKGRSMDDSDNAGEENKDEKQQNNQNQQQIKIPQQVKHANDENAIEDAFAKGMMAEKGMWRRQSPKVSVEQVARNAASIPKHIPVVTVIGMTIVMAAAAGLGALPFFFVRQLSTHWSAVATAIACGVMFAASFDLIHEGQPYGAHMVIFGVFLGGMFIKFMQKWLDGVEDVQFGHLHGSRARRLVLMVGIMAAHAMGEGCGVGVSFCGDRGWAQGVLTTLAIGVHNVPEGLAKATVLVSQGASAYEALFWSVVTCLPQPMVAVPSFIFVEAFTSLLPVALGFAAGCMMWMVFAELLPEALEGAKPSEIASAATIAAAGLEGIRMGFESLEGPAGSFAFPSKEGILERLLPAVAEAAPAVLVATMVAGTVSGSSMPTPIVLSISAVMTALCGTLPLLHLFASHSLVPLPHTVSAAIAGAVAVVLLRRYVLTALTGHKRAFEPDSGSSGIYDRSNDVYRNGHGVGFNTIDTLHARSTNHPHMHSDDDIISRLPDSPSKLRESRSDGLLGNQRQAPRRLTAPAQAAGLTVVAAVLTQAIPLGWHFTRQIASLEDHIGALTLVPAMIMTMSIYCVAVGGAVRAVVGRSVGAGGLVGFILCIITISIMSASYYHSLIVDTETVVLLSNLTYPVGWTETLTAFAGGALCIAAVFQFAVAMSMNPRHGRFGILVGVILAGAVSAIAFTGCQVVGSEMACETVSTFLQ